ncbi:hypothetical protein SE15_13240 [Thermanaerothrix daxensis]|uniref:Uncharacterized protein n=1 Tax=Thermanaerothrix daxensis TaxID=869279 RepID=A0A0P6XSH5_9CHLR|nr:hypothetical protein SE15_13240 [Thermanaerothrix daxensis]
METPRGQGIHATPREILRPPPAVPAGAWPRCPPTPRRGWAFTPAVSWPALTRPVGRSDQGSAHTGFSASHFVYSTPTGPGQRPPARWWLGTREPLPSSKARGWCVWGEPCKCLTRCGNSLPSRIAE